ncbi:MAG: hypothetical protein JWO21_1846 [Solirubrobacterales bacterium]|nr:hypothetical protein [Solirubrobacterales bacterium]
MYEFVDGRIVRASDHIDAAAARAAAEQCSDRCCTRSISIDHGIADGRARARAGMAESVRHEAQKGLYRRVTGCDRVHTQLSLSVVTFRAAMTPTLKGREHATDEDVARYCDVHGCRCG